MVRYVVPLDSITRGTGDKTATYTTNKTTSATTRHCNNRVSRRHHTTSINFSLSASN